MPALQLEIQDITVTGTPGNDTMEGGDRNDTFVGSAGDDLMMGGAGIDTASYNGTSWQFMLVKTQAQWEIYDSQGPRYGDDTLDGVERIRFNDYALALDLEGGAGLVAKTLGAVFGAGSLGNKAYAGIGLALVDGGMDFGALVQLALDAALGASASNEAVVGLLFANVVGHSPSALEAQPFVSLLESGVDRGELGAFAAQTDLNLANIGFAGLWASGLAYL